MDDVEDLVDRFLPELDGIVDRLRSGASVADLRCGCGASTIRMAQAFPRSSFIGFDERAPLVDRARQAAQEAGVARRARFEVASARDFPGRGFELICAFAVGWEGDDSVDDALRRVKEALACDGTVLVVGRDGVEAVVAAAGFRHVRVVGRTALSCVVEARA